jgi:hypothetical protein
MRSALSRNIVRSDEIQPASAGFFNSSQVMRERAWLGQYVRLRSDLDPQLPSTV